MGGVTCTIGGTTFAALASTTGRKCLECYPEDLTAAMYRFHAPGVTGNFIVRDARNGGKIYAKVRYIGTLAGALGNYNTDMLAWYNTAVTIVDENGTTWNSCNLLHMSRLSKPRSMGRNNGLVCFDAQAIFNIDG